MIKKELDQFLNGGVAINVRSDHHSQFLINLSQENGFDVGSYNGIETDTYKEYPYYFIEDNWQLQASNDTEDVLYNCESIVEFEELFELEEEIKND